jgi:hypothetical protein
MIVGFTAKSHISITGRELIEQKFGIVGSTIRESTHFIRKRLDRWKPRMATHLCAFGYHMFCDNVGWFFRFHKKKFIKKL